MNKILVILFTWLFFIVTQAGEKQTHNEKLNYTVYYNWGFVWINARSLELSNSTDTLNGNAYRFLSATGKSNPKWNWLFMLEDHYSSWYNPKTMLPVKSVKHTFENGHITQNQYLFDYNKSKVYIKTEESNKSIFFDTINLSKAIFDAQTAANYLRFLDINQLNRNDTITLAILINGSLENQQIVFKGNQLLKDENNNYYETCLFTAMVSNSNLFSSKEAINVWISAKNNRIPVYIEANITVGAIKIFLNGIKLEVVEPALHQNIIAEKCR